MAHCRKTTATRGTGEATMNINGRTYSKYLAKIIFKCAVCFSDLQYRNAGLACSVDPAHRGFVHRNNGPTEADQIKNKLSEIEEELWNRH